MGRVTKGAAPLGWGQGLWGALGCSRGSPDPPAYPSSLLSLPDTRLPHCPVPATLLLTQVLPEPMVTRNGAWEGCSAPSQTPGSLSWEQKICEQQPRAISAPVLHPTSSAKSRPTKICRFLPGAGGAPGDVGLVPQCGEHQGGFQHS